ncbi:MAG: hypothetical protein P8J37_18720 [Fuerstiella sp.]|nr:hypothetical protein [Fuerstiella sp.]
MCSADAMQAAQSPQLSWTTIRVALAPACLWIAETDATDDRNQSVPVTASVVSNKHHGSDNLRLMWQAATPEFHQSRNARLKPLLGA